MHRRMSEISIAHERQRPTLTDGRFTIKLQNEMKHQNFSFASVVWCRWNPAEQGLIRGCVYSALQGRNWRNLSSEPHIDLGEPIRTVPTNRICNHSTNFLIGIGFVGIGKAFYSIFRKVRTHDIFVLYKTLSFDAKVEAFIAQPIHPDVGRFGVPADALLSAPRGFQRKLESVDINQIIVRWFTFQNDIFPQSLNLFHDGFRDCSL